MANGTAGIVLAAGEASRFGSPKQLVHFRGKSLLSWVLDACVKSELARTFVVLGCEAERIRSEHSALLLGRNIDVVMNEHYREGLSSSIRAGVQAAMDAYSAVMFLLADTPFVTSELINEILTSFGRLDKRICVAMHGSRIGHPCVFHRDLYPELLDLHGDRGARTVIDAHASETLYIPMHTDQPFIDIDTESDLRGLS